MPEFSTDIFTRFDKQWGLLCAGTMANHNAMSISWGGMGTLWNKPVVTVYVNPLRYTYQFIEENEYFTVSFLPEELKKIHGVMGVKSGRDTDKDREARLTPVPAGESVTYAEAAVTLLCRKIYHQDFNIDQVPADVVAEHYMTEPVHRMYIGEVIDIIRNTEE